ncbi:MAG: F0F1 ATP synthase subunit B' [Alphaproteobacteria bacterium]
MPQLDVDTFGPQLVWLAITFSVFFLVMWRLALPRVAMILEERRNHIESDVAKATRLREETAQALTDYETALAEAKSRAHAMVKQVREDTAAALQNQRAESDKAIAAKMEEAEQRIGQVRDAAVTHISEISTDVAQAVVAQVIGVTTDSGEMRSAVNEALGK